MRLDSHQHFWKYDAGQYPWIKADWPIRRDFLPTDLQPLLSASNLEGSIAVQARQSLEESRWLLHLAALHPLIKGVVGWVDLSSNQLEEQLAEFSKQPRFVGVRHVVQDEPDDRFMLRAEFLRGIAQLSQLKLTYDILIYPRQLPAAIELAKRFPEQRFVVDHLAKPSIRLHRLSPWREQMAELARWPNVWCKVSGLITEADHKTWQPAELRPYLDVVFERFDKERLMYGSDWPVCLLSGSYAQVFGLVKDYTEHLSIEEQNHFFGGNATEFYRIDLSP